MSGRRRRAIWAAPLTLATACVLGGPQAAPDASLAAQLRDSSTVPVAAGPTLHLGGGEVDGVQVEAVAANNEEGQLCIFLVSEAGVEGATCGQRRAVDRVFGFLGADEVLGGSALLISAFVGSDVERVEVVTRAGTQEAPVLRLDRLGAGLRGFAVALPRELGGVTLRGIGADGEVLDQVVDLAPLRGP